MDTEKYGVIDVGSNSVRLMTVFGDYTEKYVKITKLAEGIGKNSRLTENAMERTADAVLFFIGKAKEFGADEIFVFATAAVRQAENGDVFTRKIFDKSGVKVDVISGEKEAEIGARGVLGGGDGGIIDIGGASSEIAVYKNGKKEYAYSLPIGCVKVETVCGQDREENISYCRKKVEEYGDIPETDFYGVGGTITTVAAMILELEKFDRKVVDGFVIEKEKAETLRDKLFSLRVEERKKLKGLQPERA